VSEKERKTTAVGMRNERKGNGIEGRRTARGRGGKSGLEGGGGERVSLYQNRGVGSGLGRGWVGVGSGLR
jgi:hypothetical protein